MEQELYDLIFSKIKKLGYDCYQSLPRKGSKYPFVILGETQIMPRATKSFAVGELSIFIHVWTSDRSRAECQRICQKIREECGKLEKLHSFYMFESNTRILIDDTTNQTLWHGVMDLNYKFY